MDFFEALLSSDQTESPPCRGDKNTWLWSGVQNIRIQDQHDIRIRRPPRLAAAIPSPTLSLLDKTARGGDPLLISPLLEASLVTSDMLGWRSSDEKSFLKKETLLLQCCIEDRYCYCNTCNDSTTRYLEILFKSFICKLEFKFCLNLLLNFFVWSSVL